MGKKKRNLFWHYFIGIVISVIAVIAVVYLVDWREFWRSTRDVNYIWVVPSMACTVAAYAARGFQWRYLLIRRKRLGVWKLFKIVMIGFLSNVILPARLGELVRAILLARWERMSKSFSFSTVIVSRIFDGFVLFTLLAVLLLLVPRTAVLKGAGTTGFLIYVGIVAFFLLHYFNRGTTKRILGKAVAPISKKIAVRIIRSMDKFAEGFHIVRDPMNLLKTLAYSFLIWGLVGLSYYFLMLGFNFSAPLPLYTPYLMLALVSLAIAVPSSPGFIGTMEIGCLVALQIANPAINRHESISFAIILHVTQLIPVVVLGIIFFWTEHLSFRDITAAEEELATVADGTGR
jgi:uncharacterized protein (TIRG00374 family)